MTDAYLEALENEKAKLDQTGQNFGYITSLENRITGNKGGVVTEVPNSIAARMILDRTARVSTPEEIDAHRGPSGANPAEATV
jgi:hypothetical protein